MTREEYLQKINKAEIENEGDFGWEYFSKYKISEEYIEYLELYLKSTKDQCETQDKIIKYAEDKLGKGFWQNF